jgi:hypothetical protein
VSLQLPLVTPAGALGVRLLLFSLSRSFVLLVLIAGAFSCARSLRGL